MHNLARVKFLVFLLIAVVVVGYTVYNSDWFQKKFFYPFPYQDIVYRCALENEVDPYLVAGIIKTESKFIPHALSPKGAMGLMQLMPETAAWIATQISYPDFSPSLLNDPEINIRFGVWYLASLQKEFKHNETLMLAAYNGGRGNVKQWMKQFGWTYSFAAPEQIPFQETREYVGKVLRNQRHYRDLYGR